MNDDVYVRKDVYDANMAEIKALMSASEARMARQVDKVLARHARDLDILIDEIKSIRERQDNTDKRFDRFEAKVDRFISIAMFVIGAAALIVTAMPLYLAFFK